MLAYPGEGNSSLCEQIAKDYFIASLADRDLRFGSVNRAIWRMHSVMQFVWRRMIGLWMVTIIPSSRS